MSRSEELKNAAKTTLRGYLASAGDGADLRGPKVKENINKIVDDIVEAAVEVAVERIIEMKEKNR